jgi:cellulose synthase/poly-beta-1,6-N-acetylglucosamine synthase-like glycosyltransferase
MTALISICLVAVATLLLIPSCVLLAEIIGALAGAREGAAIPPSRSLGRKAAILVPAHNEGAGLLPTLSDIKAQMGASGRLLVIADNCTDDTEAVARSAGAEVVVRNDLSRRGKGYALACGIEHLSADPPDVLIVVDADCRLAPDVIDRLVTACTSENRPVQALYLMNPPPDTSLKYGLAQFAWRMKNWARPLGLRALGLPCQLMGTGMAFPWSVACAVDFADGSLVEDLKIGLEMALAGSAPVFCPPVGVTSDFPTSTLGVKTQRQRWEQGHIGTIISTAPRLLAAGIWRRDRDLIALALDLAVPPLSLLAMFLTALLFASVILAILTRNFTALYISLAAFAGFVIAVFLCWRKFGRDILTPAAIFLIPGYVIGKFPIYVQLFRKSGSKWIRTDRRKA